MLHKPPTQQPPLKTKADRPAQILAPPLPTPIRPIVHHPSSIANRRAAWQAIQRRLAQPLIQRDIPNKVYKGEHSGPAEAYAIALDNAVQKAWAAVQEAPLLGGLAGYDGHTQLWADKIEDFANTSNDPGGLHTSFGYVIESLATGPLKPDPPSGYHIILQGSRGGTRPDAILRHNFRDAAWLDITASNSKNHIFDKEGGWQQVPNFAEITYPSVGFAELIKMKNKVATTAGDELNLGVDPLKILAEKRAAQLALDQKRNNWQRLGTAWLAPVKKISQSKWPNADEMRANMSKRLLAKNLEIEEGLDDRTAASIINAMKLNSATFGFRTGVSVSTSTGISILQDIDPSTITIDRELVREKRKEREERKKSFKSESKLFGKSKEEKREQKAKDIKDRREENYQKRRGITKKVAIDMDDSSEDN